MREGMAAVIQAPLNHFTLGTGNFLAAGDAAGFMHNGGEGISCALTTGNLAAEAILSAEETGLQALEVYRTAVRDEAELCLDQFNPLRMMKTFPFQMDMKGLWKKYSLKETLHHVAGHEGLWSRRTTVLPIRASGGSRNRTCSTASAMGATGSISSS